MKKIAKKNIKYSLVEAENEKERKEIQELIEEASNEKVDVTDLKKIDK